GRDGARVVAFDANEDHVARVPAPQLSIREIGLGHRVRERAFVPDVADLTDNGDVAGIEVGEALADRTLSGEIPFGQRFIDHDDFRYTRSRIIVVAQEAAGDEMLAGDAEEPR